MVQFEEICKLFEDVQNANGLQNKNEIIKNNFAIFREKIKFFSNERYLKFYEIIRLIVPKIDHGRKSYNMKENRIARTVIKMLNLGDGTDKRNLNTHGNVSLDFSEIVHLTLRKYILNSRATISVNELNEHLDLIANRNSDSILDDLMLKLFKKLTPQESKWVVRIILKDLKLGIDNNRILNTFHPDAAEFYSSNTNLKKVCEILWNPSVHLHEMSIVLFEPFQPMLSKRCDAKSFTRDIPNDRTFITETKFDGERFQLHMSNGKFKYFSRNGYDFTNEFGENYTKGILTPKLKDVFHHFVKEIILDGEMMLWNTKYKKFGSKGMSFDVKKLKESHYYQPCFCIFDILFLNDIVLTNKELTFRLETLKKSIQRTIEGTIIVSEFQETKSRQEIIDALNKMMDNEGEGIVIKDPKSIYKFRDRKSGWYKMKLEYFEETVTDLDVILMGGFHKTSVLNSFLIGVYSGDNAVLSMGRVSSGLNLDEFEIVSKKLIEKGKPYSNFKNESKGNLLFGKDVPDVWIEPEDSIIFTIRATELIRSNKDFRTPYTHRFPRILRIRNDKSYRECLSINELLEICKQNKAVIKLNKRHLTLDEIISFKPRKLKKILDINIESLKKLNNCLKCFKFYVLSGNECFPINKIEELVQKCGGTFSLNFEQDVNIVIVGDLTENVLNFLKNEGSYDVIKVDWLQRICDTNELQKYKQNDVLKIGTSFYNSLADDVDMYGDSYTEELNDETLKNRLEIMSETGYRMNINNSIHYQPDLPLFHKYTAYFDRFEEINNSNSKRIYDSFLDEIEFKYRKGTVMDVLNNAVNLIIVNQASEKRESLLENYTRAFDNGNVQIIDRNLLYIEESF